MWTIYLNCSTVKNVLEGFYKGIGTLSLLHLARHTFIQIACKF